MRAAIAFLAIGMTACSPSASAISPSQMPEFSEAPSSVSPSGPPTVALEDRLEATIGITGADFPLIAFDAVWVVAADRDEPAIVRVDPETNTVAAEILVPGRGCNGAAAGFEAIWACSSDGIARIDPATNSVVTVIPVEAIGQARLATGAGSVWVFTRLGDGLGGDAVVRIDPVTNTPVATIALDHQLGTMAFGFDALWVTSPEDGLLLRVDPAANQVTPAMDGLVGPFAVAIGPDSIWVSLYGAEGAAPAASDATVIRIDPETVEVVASMVTDPIGMTGNIGADETSIWVRSSGVFLTHIDPATNEVVEVVSATKGGGDLVLGFGSVWASSFDFHQLWRITPDGA